MSHTDFLLPIAGLLLFETGLSTQPKLSWNLQCKPGWLKFIEIYLSPSQSAGIKGVWWHAQTPQGVINHNSKQFAPLIFPWFCLHDHFTDNQTVESIRITLNCIYTLAAFTQCMIILSLTYFLKYFMLTEKYLSEDFTVWKNICNLGQKWDVFKTGCLET